jgi:hypothetical protein
MHVDNNSAGCVFGDVLSANFGVHEWRIAQSLRGA